MWTPLERWGDFRRRQIAALEQSNRIAAAHLEAADGVSEGEGGPNPGERESGGGGMAISRRVVARAAPDRGPATRAAAGSSLAPPFATSSSRPFAIKLFQDAPRSL